MSEFFILFTLGKQCLVPQGLMRMQLTMMYDPLQEVMMEPSFSYILGLLIYVEWK